jgi:hypothetical protein
MFSMLLVLSIVLYICSSRLYCVVHETIRQRKQAAMLKNSLMKYQTPMAFSHHHPSIINPPSSRRRDGLEAREVGRRRQLEQLKIPKNNKRKQNVS